MNASAPKTTPNPTNSATTTAANARGDSFGMAPAPTNPPRLPSAYADMMKPNAAAPSAKRVWASTGTPTISGPATSMFATAIIPNIQRTPGRETANRKPSRIASERVRVLVAADGGQTRAGRAA